MMAAFIFVVSLVIFLQFFVFYCRSLIAVSSKQALSPEVQEVTFSIVAQLRKDNH